MSSWKFDLPPRRAAQLALALFAIAVVVWLFIAAGSAMTPFLIGVALMYLLAPTVNVLARHMPRGLAIGLVYLIAALLIGALFVFVVPLLITQVQRLIENLPSVEALRSWSQNLIERYHDFTPDALEPQVEQAIQSALPALQGNLSTIVRNALAFVISQLSGLVSLISFVVGLLIIPIWLFYLLNDQRKVFVFINRLLNFKIRADFWNVWRLVDRSLSAYIRGQLTLGLIIAVAIGIGLGVLDLIPGIEVDYILLLAIWAGVCELIPMIGALLGMVPGVIIAFVLGGPVSGFAVLALYVIVQQVENNLLVPRIIGDSVGVHPAILTVTLIALGSVFGLPGVITAAPVTAIARDLYLYAFRRLGGATAPDTLHSLEKNKDAPAK
jgi:predicted PurR-regulated permease PerM